MEHEIFNNEDDEIASTKYEYKQNNLSKLFSLKFISYFLSILSLFFVFLNTFIGILTYNRIVFAIFFLIAFGLALSALIISLINKFKNNETKISLQIILSIVAIIINFI